MHKSNAIYLAAQHMGKVVIWLCTISVFTSTIQQSNQFQLVTTVCYYSRLKEMHAQQKTFKNITISRVWLTTCLIVQLTKQNSLIIITHLIC